MLSKDFSSCLYIQVVSASGAIKHEEVVEQVKKAFTKLSANPTTTSQLVASDPANFTGSEVCTCGCLAWNYFVVHYNIFLPSLNLVNNELGSNYWWRPSFGTICGCIWRSLCDRSRFCYFDGHADYAGLMEQKGWGWEACRVCIPCSAISSRFENCAALNNVWSAEYWTTCLRTKRYVLAFGNNYIGSLTYILASYFSNKKPCQFLTTTVMVTIERPC